jgi:hypothetical protein
MGEGSFSAVCEVQVKPTDQLAEAVQALRAVLEDFPPASPPERGTARRIEGALAALEAVQQTIESETADGDSPPSR